MCLCFGSLSRDSRVELLELVGGMDLIMAHELSMRDRRQAGRQAGRTRHELKRIVVSGGREGGLISSRSPHISKSLSSSPSKAKCVFGDLF